MKNVVLKATNVEKRLIIICLYSELNKFMQKDCEQGVIL